MKTGKSIVELAQELERLSGMKRDFVAPTTELVYGTTGDGKPKLKVNGHGEMPLTAHANSQLVDYTGVPRKYADKMLVEAPGLLAENVNHWLHQKAEPRMIRGLGEQWRAFMSNRYRRIEHEQILAAAYPVLRDMASQGEMIIRSTEVTMSRLHIQVSFPMITGEAKVGDIVEAGFSMSNSEIGGGAIVVDPWFWRKWCNNGAISRFNFESGSLRRTHLGRILEAEEAREIFADDTKEADDKALLLKVRDAMLAMSKREIFDRAIEEMQRAAGTKIENPVKVVDRVAEIFQLPEPTKVNLLTNLIKDGDLSVWGLVNAVTALAHSANDYDSNIEYQKMGGKLLAVDYKELLAA